MSGVAPSPILSDIKALWQAGLLDFLGTTGGAFDVASQAETEALTNNTKGITPLRGAQQAAHLFGRTVADEAAMLALTDVVVGTEVKRADLDQWWKLEALPASSLANWGPLDTPDTGGIHLTMNGGPDYKLVTEAVTGDGARIATYTDDTGIIWTKNYNDAGDGSLQTETALGGLLVRNWSYTLNGLGYISSGAVKKSGKAWRVASADMAAIKVQLALLGAAVEAPLFWVYDKNMTVEWNNVNACFRPVDAGVLAFAAAANLPSLVAPGIVETTAYTSPVFPGWLRGPLGTWECSLWANYPGEVGNKTTRWKVNGTGFLTVISGAVTRNAVAHQAKLEAVGDGVMQQFAGSGSVANGFSVDNGIEIPASFALAAGTDLTFTATTQYGDAGDGANTVTLPKATILYRHP